MRSRSLALLFFACSPVVSADRLHENNTDADSGAASTQMAPVALAVIAGVSAAGGMYSAYRNRQKTNEQITIRRQEASDSLCKTWINLYELTGVGYAYTDVLMRLMNGEEKSTDDVIRVFCEHNGDTNVRDACTESEHEKRAQLVLQAIRDQAMSTVAKQSEDVRARTMEACALSWQGAGLSDQTLERQMIEEAVEFQVTRSGGVSDSSGKVLRPSGRVPATGRLGQALDSGVAAFSQLTLDNAHYLAMTEMGWASFSAEIQSWIDGVSVFNPQKNLMSWMTGDVGSKAYTYEGTLGATPIIFAVVAGQAVGGLVQVVSGYLDEARNTKSNIELTEHACGQLLDIVHGAQDTQMIMYQFSRTIRHLQKDLQPLPHSTRDLVRSIYERWLHDDVFMGSPKVQAKLCSEEADLKRSGGMVGLLAAVLDDLPTSPILPEAVAYERESWLVECTFASLVARTLMDIPAGEVAMLIGQSYSSLDVAMMSARQAKVKAGIVEANLLQSMEKWRCSDIFFVQRARWTKYAAIRNIADNAREGLSLLSADEKPPCEVADLIGCMLAAGSEFSSSESYMSNTMMAWETERIRGDSRANAKDLVQPEKKALESLAAAFKSGFKGSGWKSSIENALRRNLEFQRAMNKPFESRIAPVALACAEFMDRQIEELACEDAPVLASFLLGRTEEFLIGKYKWLGRSIAQAFSEPLPKLISFSPVLFGKHPSIFSSHQTLLNQQLFKSDPFLLGLHPSVFDYLQSQEKLRMEKEAEMQF